MIRVSRPLLVAPEGLSKRPYGLFYNNR
jgi:hypothetical protein